MMDIGQYYIVQVRARILSLFTFIQKQVAASSRSAPALLLISAQPRIVFLSQFSRAQFWLAAK